MEHDETTEVQQFRQAIWMEVAAGENDFLTRPEMASVLYEIADELDRANEAKWDSEEHMQSAGYDGDVNGAR